MREITFRGKRIDNGKWVEGFYTHTSQYHPPCIHKNTIDVFEVLPETVSQFTGHITPNSIKVFEGDIVQVSGTKRVGLYETEVIHNRYGFTLKENKTYFTDDACLKLSKKVIGNIFDNPNLLNP